jgi:hypothetical protein
VTLLLLCGCRFVYVVVVSVSGRVWGVLRFIRAPHVKDTLSSLMLLGTNVHPRRVLRIAPVHLSSLVGAFWCQVPTATDSASFVKVTLDANAYGYVHHIYIA